jgi:hypothetical protein
MAEEIKAVEITPIAAPADSGVENKQPEAPGVDYEAVVSTLLDEQKRLETERDNYRKGMLKAKGKLPAEEVAEEDEDLDTKIDRKVQERLTATKAAQAQTQLEETIKKMAKDLKETKLALANRSQLKPTNTQVTGDATVDVPDNILSPEALEECKRAGWSEEKIKRLKQNMAKSQSVKF